MSYDPGAKAVLDLIQHRLDYTQQVMIHWLPNTFLSLSPTEAILPRVLYEEEVWPSSLRGQYLQVMSTQRGALVGTEFSYVERTGCNFGILLAETLDLVGKEEAPAVTEWHIASIMVERGRKTLVGLGIKPDMLLQRVGALCGRVVLSEAERAKAWCFCDTNVFLHYRMFDEVDWHKGLDLESVVLVVPTLVLRELDRLKHGQPDKGRSKRAGQVLRKLVNFALAAPAGTPTLVRKGVELLLLHREPAHYPDGLVPEVDDDRLLATAIEFRWTHPGARVIVVSGDGLMRVKAHGHGLEQWEIPAKLEVRRVGDEQA